MSSVSFLTAEPTFLGAVTTTFTPPASCLGTTAAVDSNGIPFQMFTGGVAEGDIIASGYLHTECYPSAYPATAGVNFGAYFSPGVCPFGYTTAATMMNGSETRAICCISGLTANDLLNCQTSVTNSLLTASQFFTVEPGPLHPIETGAKSAGSIELIGSAIEIRFQAGGIPSTTIQSQTTHSTTSSDTYVPNSEGSTFTQTRTTLTLASQTSTGKPNSGSSTRAKIGIGLAVPGALLAAVATGMIVVLW